ncbi:MAG: flavin reductase family protein [Flammeovirgaceae bacterium]
MQRPWNVINVPVYSLATEVDGVPNMNICTYVTAVSMKPKRYMVAVYENTQTLANLKHTDRAVLQLLSSAHLPLINTLGKKSGKKYNKQQYLKKRSMLQTWQGHTVLKDAAAYVLLKSISHQSAGDHVMYLFEVEKFMSQTTPVLMLDDLRANKLISI